MTDLEFLTKCMYASQERKQTTKLEVDRGMICLTVCDTIYEYKTIQECIDELRRNFSELHLKITISKP